MLDFWRCPMIPLRDPDAETGHADSFDAIPDELDPERVQAAMPEDGDSTGFRPGPRRALRRHGGRHDVRRDQRETVTAAAELARLTLNLATRTRTPAPGVTGSARLRRAHDLDRGRASGRGVANLVTIVAWHRCDHLAPVFEGDILSTSSTSRGRSRSRRAAGLVDLRGESAPNGGGGETIDVLDWKFVAVMA